MTRTAGTVAGQSSSMIANLSWPESIFRGINVDV